MYNINRRKNFSTVSDLKKLLADAPTKQRWSFAVMITAGFTLRKMKV